jgi:hypothetical protein
MEKEQTYRNRRVDSDHLCSRIPVAGDYSYSLAPADIEPGNQP